MTQGQGGGSGQHPGSGSGQGKRRSKHKKKKSGGFHAGDKRPHGQGHRQGQRHAPRPQQQDFRPERAEPPAPPPEATLLYELDTLPANLPGHPLGFIEQNGFIPDAFQQEAMLTIAEGHSTVVCAPTGSGKTLIAEYAAYKALHDGKRIFYTTPLKALSNQKFSDFKKQYGPDHVGLLTGDLSINRDARIVVMTTEIFRNMLYGIQIDPTYLESVGYVVLDECHYMNDAERGTVWEESIIYCPRHIQIIALSATVANAHELADWINDVHHDTRLIESDYRPVPLRFSFYDRDRLVPLFEGGGNSRSQMNRQLKTHQKGNRFSKDARSFRPNFLIEELHQRDMLPAIFFSFSRKDCDQYLKDTGRLQLLNDLERRQINAYIDEYVTANPHLANSPNLPLMRNGFASHHAGLLPGIKHLSEILFQKGLIKVIFATETLAAGINMPARTTVITKISKRADEGHRLLTANEFLQMSGRAGRRGMDPVGYVVIVSSQYEGAREAATLAASESDPLNSRFTPTYGMVLNLLQRHSLQQSEFLIRQSFGQYTAQRRLLPLQEDIVDKTEYLQELLNFQCPASVSDEDFHRYLKTRIRWNETQHFIRDLKKQIKHYGQHPDILQQLAHESAKRDNLQQTMAESPCQQCDILHRHEKAEDRIQRLQKQLKELNKIYDAQKDCYWQGFLNIYRFLKDQDFIDTTDIPTDRGKITTQLRSENEYFMAQCLMSGHLDALAPDQLAAAVSALVNDSNKERDFAKLDISGEVHHALGALNKLARRVYHQQQRFHIHMEIRINPVASGLVQAWAQGLPWERVMSATNLGEGDFVRHVRRTMDMLRQIARLELTTPGQQGLVNPALINSARLALARLDREPVKEVEVVEVAEQPAQPASPEPEETDPPGVTIREEGPVSDIEAEAT